MSHLPGISSAKRIAEVTSRFLGQQNNTQQKGGAFPYEQGLSNGRPRVATSWTHEGLAIDQLSLMELVLLFNAWRGDYGRRELKGQQKRGRFLEVFRVFLEVFRDFLEVFRGPLRDPLRGRFLLRGSQSCCP